MGSQSFDTQPYSARGSSVSARNIRFAASHLMVDETAGLRAVNGSMWVLQGISRCAGLLMRGQDSLMRYIYMLQEM